MAIVELESGKYTFVTEDKCTWKSTALVYIIRSATEPPVGEDPEMYVKSGCEVHHPGGVKLWAKTLSNSGGRIFVALP